MLMEEWPLDSWESEGGSLRQSLEDEMTNADYTHIAVIADRSGSMYTIQDDMNNGLKTFLEEQNLFPGKLLVDLTTFDSTVDRVLLGGSVEDVVHPIIQPRGMTALLDGIGVTVTSLGERLASMAEADRPGKVIVMIVTDGGENSSTEYTNERIKELVTTQREKYQWEFIFLGANIDSFSVAGSWGIPAGSTINYTASSTGANSVMNVASMYVTRSRTGTATAFTDEERDQTMGNLSV